LSDFSGTALSSSNLPTSLNLASFQSTTFHLNLQSHDPFVDGPPVNASADISGNIDSIQLQDVKPQATPEPASWLLLGLGLLSAPVLVKLRRKSAAA
jgi:hypothetical protein